MGLFSATTWGDQQANVTNPDRTRLGNNRDKTSRGVERGTVTLGQTVGGKRKIEAAGVVLEVENLHTAIGVETREEIQHERAAEVDRLTARALSLIHI